MSKRAVIYCRVSTKEQVEEGNSLATQEKICKDYALKNGYDIAEIFIEEGESAKTTDRTQLQLLLKYCSIKKNNISAVIIYKLDRISRNTEAYFEIRLLLRRYGVEIKSTSKYFDNSSPAGRFMENIIVNVGQFDNDVRTERCIGGMRDAMRDGRYVWNAPVGYDNTKVLGRANIVPNDKAPLVKEAFTRVALKEVPESIRHDLTKKGLQTKRGKPLTKSAFYKLLKNEAYFGWIVKLGERHKGTYEPLISESLYRQARNVLEKRTRKSLSYQVRNPDFPLRCFVKHPEGGTLTGAWSKGRKKKYPYYRFRNSTHSFNGNALEEVFAKLMNECRLNEKHFKKLKSDVREHLIKAKEDQLKEAHEKKQFISELEVKKRELVRKNVKGLLTDETLNEHLELIREEISNASMSLEELPDINVDYEELLDFVEEYLKNPGKIWAIAPFQERLELQWFNFPSGIFFDGEICRTGEIANVFKTKGSLELPLSFRVDFKTQTLNHCKSVKPGLISENPVQLTRNPNGIWDKVGREIICLADILKRINQDE